MLQCTVQPHNKAQKVNSAKVIETRIQKAEKKFRLSVRALLKSFLSPWKYASWLCHSSSKFFLTSHLSAHKMLQDLTYFSILIYYCPIDPFFWQKQATLFPDSLCLKDCYSPNKQQSSFVEVTPFFKIQPKLYFLYEAFSDSSARLRHAFSVLLQHCELEQTLLQSFHTTQRLIHLLVSLSRVLLLRAYKFKCLQHLSRYSINAHGMNEIKHDSYSRHALKWLPNP